MRWDIIKKAWSLASEKFPDKKRLFVALPDQFRGIGDCDVYDLDNPETPLGIIHYEAHCENGTPVMSLSLKDMVKKAEFQRVPSLHVKTAGIEGELKPRTSISVKEIMTKHSGPEQLGECAAYLIAGHEEGIPGDQIHEGIIESWFDDHGFPKESIPFAQAKLEQLGIKIARRKRKRFENYEKVRVVDPRIREYNEGAQILGRRRDKEGKDWYQVIVDGSDKPIWLMDEQLDSNSVGSIRDVSSLDQQESA